jgi:predicted secreted protein
MSKAALHLLCSAVAVVPILFMNGCALANELEDGAHTRIQFDARAYQLVENDAMRATLFVEIEDSTPSSASSRVTRAANEALRQLRRDKDLQVRTGAYRSYPTSDKGKITGWRARSELIIESEKPARVSAAIESVSGTMQLSGVAFYVSPKLRDEVETVLEDQAIRAFLSKAKRIAKSFGATQFQVLEATVINEGGGSPPQPMMRAMAADAAAIAPEFGSGTTRLSVTVSGVILIPR